MQANTGLSKLAYTCKPDYLSWRANNRLSMLATWSLLNDAEAVIGRKNHWREPMTWQYRNVEAVVMVVETKCDRIVLDSVTASLIDVTIDTVVNENHLL